MLDDGVGVGFDAGVAAAGLPGPAGRCVSINGLGRRIMCLRGVPFHGAAGEAIDGGAFAASGALASPEIVVDGVGTGDGGAILLAYVGALVDGAGGSSSGQSGCRCGDGSAESHVGGLEWS